jgi:hypothetical protein
MRPIVDIFSADFFAEDPFGESHNHAETFEALSLDLYTVEEDLSHVNTLHPKRFSEQGVDSTRSNSLLVPPSSVAFVGDIVSDSGPNDHVQHPKEGHEPQDHKGITFANMQELDSETQATCRSTDFDSIPNATSTRSSLEHDKSRPLMYGGNDRSSECMSASCAIQRLILKQQEEQIRFLRSRLQQYADLCARYSIGEDLLPKAEDYGTRQTSSNDGTTRTNYEDRTYEDLMGPWDIPFHVEVLQGGVIENSDEYSGITFAQHPSKSIDTVPKLRSCRTDDDDTLPVIRPYLNRSKGAPRNFVQGRHSDLSSSKLTPSRPPTSELYYLEARPQLPSSRHSRSKDIRCKKQSSDMDKAMLRLPSLDESCPTGTTHEQLTIEKETVDNESRVNNMSVVIDRKYGRQKALYSGTIHPNSGCPHGMGTLRFVDLGDVYIGEIAYGEMHGFGAYWHRKTHKLFRGRYHRNSFVGKQSK